MIVQNIQTYNKILIDGTIEAISDFKYKSDIDFLISKGLIEKINDDIRVCFVGEIFTPNSRFISVPNNFDKTDESINITRKVLREFKSLKRNDKVLMENRTFTTEKGEIESEIVYFKKLKEYFMDNITYKFIYPKKTLRKHSSISIGSKFDMLETFINNKKKGPGITYKINDLSNESWNTDISITNIYYSLLIKLCSEYGSEKDYNDIIEKGKYFKSIGYKFELIDLEVDKDILIGNIERSIVNTIHQPIKNTLINYYKTMGVSEKYKIRAFYSNNFKYVMDYFLKTVLNHNKNFNDKALWKNPNNKDLTPDIFSEFNGKSIFCYCQYGNIINNDYTKEMYEYNNCQDNKYPMVVLIPSNSTELPNSFINPYKCGYNRFELIIIKVSILDIVLDAINRTKSSVSRIHDIVYENTNRLY